MLAHAILTVIAVHERAHHPPPGDTVEPLVPLSINATRRLLAKLVINNYDAACPASYPRPAGFSCDEYPYQSTWEGAYMGAGGSGGRTFGWCQLSQLPTGVTGPGYSSCMIPETENSSGGSLLGHFYNSERVLDEDGFYVWVYP